MKKTGYRVQGTGYRKLHTPFTQFVRPITYHLSPITYKVKPGFTLIEMMVAVSIFAMVMLIGVGALLSLVEANRRAQSLNSVINNLNAALEGISRSVRVGTDYHCGAWNDLTGLSVPKDCVSGGELLAFESSGGDRNNSTDQVLYRLNRTTNRLERSLDAGSSWVALTAPEVAIENFTFYVLGSANTDDVQPRVIINIKGSASTGKITSNFHVQATVAQRIIDI